MIYFPSVKFRVNPWQMLLLVLPFEANASAHLLLNEKTGAQRKCG
jgi:hypothetical protein